MPVPATVVRPLPKPQAATLDPSLDPSLVLALSLALGLVTFILGGIA
jgi:hypothetical protein